MQARIGAVCKIGLLLDGAAEQQKRLIVVKARERDHRRASAPLNRELPAHDFTRGQVFLFQCRSLRHIGEGDGVVHKILTQLIRVDPAGVVRSLRILKQEDARGRVLGIKFDELNRAVFLFAARPSVGHVDRVAAVGRSIGDERDQLR